jgi:hypothetical protein
LPKGPVDQRLVASLNLDASAIDKVLGVITQSADQLDGMARAASA